MATMTQTTISEMVNDMAVRFAELKEYMEDMEGRAEELIDNLGEETAEQVDLEDFAADVRETMDHLNGLVSWLNREVRELEDMEVDAN